MHHYFLHRQNATGVSLKRIYEWKMVHVTLGQLPATSFYALGFQQQPVVGPD